MPHVILKIPKKLKDARIIHSEDIIESRELDSEEGAAPGDKSFREYDYEEIENLPDEDEDEINSDEPEPEVPVFYHTYSINNYNTPIELSPEKFESYDIDLEEVKVRVQDAYNQGFADGQETTAATFKTQIQRHHEWLKNMDSVVNELRAQYASEIENLEDTVVKLSIMAAEHILGREATSNSEIVIEQVKKAIKSLDEDKVFKIHIHPDNIEILESVKSELTSDKSQIKDVEIVSNETVGKGGCILETSAGMVDARLKTQLEQLEKSLNEAMSKNRPEVDLPGNRDDEKSDEADDAE